MRYNLTYQPYLHVTMVSEVRSVSFTVKDVYFITILIEYKSLDFATAAGAESSNCALAVI